MFSLSVIVNRRTGGRWKKLNASAHASDVATPAHNPQNVETTSTASR